MPAGMEIIIAMQNPNAITTNNALTLRLEMFLTALVKTPNCFTFQSFQKKIGQPKREAFERRMCFSLKASLAVLTL